MCQTEFVVICTILPQVHKHSDWTIHCDKVQSVWVRVEFFLIPETILIWYWTQCCVKHVMSAHTLPELEVRLSPPNKVHLYPEISNLIKQNLSKWNRDIVLYWHSCDSAQGIMEPLKRPQAFICQCCQIIIYAEIVGGQGAVSPGQLRLTADISHSSTCTRCTIARQWHLLMVCGHNSLNMYVMRITITAKSFHLNFSHDCAMYMA